MNSTTELVMASAPNQDFNPWKMPDSFTVWNFAPDYVRPYLHPHWQTQPAVHPIWSYFFGFYYLCMGTVAITGNSMVLRILSKTPALRTPSNMLVMNLAIADLLLMLGLVPECIWSFFCGGPWQFGHLGCQIHAFMGALCGYTQITTLTLISWDRYNVIVKGLSGTRLTYGKVTALILFSWIWALGWSVSPLVGWGHYALDGMLGSCSFDHYTQTMNHKTHILAATIVMFALPILIIIGSYFFIVQAIFKHEEELRAQARKMNVKSLRSTPEQQAVSAEIRIAKVAIINVSLWIFAWTPFAVVGLVGTWMNPGYVSALVSEIPVTFAKTSCMYNPLVYALSHPKFREALKELYPWLCIVIEKKKGKGGDNDSTGSETTNVTSESIEQ